MMGTASLARELWPEKQPCRAMASAQLHNEAPILAEAPGHDSQVMHLFGYGKVCYFIFMHGQRVVIVAGRGGYKENKW